MMFCNSLKLALSVLRLAVFAAYLLSLQVVLVGFQLLPSFVYLVHSLPLCCLAASRELNM